MRRLLPGILCLLGLGSLLLVSPSSAQSIAHQVKNPTLSQSITNAGWHFEHVDGGKVIANVGERSLRLDAAGWPHVVYGGDKLYYASRDDTGWHIETVDDGPGVGEYASLGLDQSGNPHIAYYDQANSRLKYAYRAASEWQIEIVDDWGNVGEWASLALDSSGNPSVSYYVNTGNGYTSYLRYPRRVGGVWSTERVGAETGIGDFSALVLGCGDRAYIVYRVYHMGRLRYVRWTGGFWEAYDIMPSDTYFQSSIVVDSHCTPHISYVYYGLGYSTRERLYYTSAGSISELDGMDGVVRVRNTSIVLDSGQRPRIGYATISDLRYATWNGSSWSIQVVDSSPTMDINVSLALDAGDNPHLLYHDLGHNELRYAYWRDEPTPTSTPTPTATPTPTSTPTPTPTPTATPQRLWLPVVFQEQWQWGIRNYK